MKLQFLAAVAAAAIAASTAGSAFAADLVTAKLQQPVAAKTKLIAGGAVFFCESDACTASGSNPRTLTAGSCKDLAKEVGVIASYGSARKQLDADKLAQCNASAATQVAKQ
jgi:hypothetical protein